MWTIVATAEMIIDDFIIAGVVFVVAAFIVVMAEGFDFCHNTTTRTLGINDK